MDFLAAQPESYIKIGLLPMLDDDKVKNEIVFDWIQVKKSIDFTKFLTINWFHEKIFIYFLLNYRKRFQRKNLKRLLLLTPLRALWLRAK